ncbi:hypothetical protein [Ottowia sp.]|uniref:hypothetical protein n=1 Tax=Ottowia sp. TaxID=1898956 RepID=UPI003A8808E1
MPSKFVSSLRARAALALIATSSITLLACGGANGPDGESGNAVGARAQTIVFATAPTLVLGGTATVSATANSGLTVRYGSDTPTVCTVDAQSGTVTALTPGTCTIAASQDGDATWAAATRATLALPVQVDAQQQIGFGAAPTLVVGASATVSAIASSGLAVAYSSLTPAVCSVDAASGLVTALAVGTCTIAADQPGDAHYNAATQATQSFAINAAPVQQAPGAPGEVSASAGTQSGTVLVTAGQVDSGGSAIVQYIATSVPPGITAQSASLPVVVSCPASGCAGYAFVLQAANAVGTGPASAAADVVTDYDVVVKFKEPDYAYDMTEFHGRFTYNATLRNVSGLQGELSEVMAGLNQANQPYPDGMPLLPLTHQLSSIDAPAGDGLLITSFLLASTHTLSDDARDGGTDGFSPGTGGWKYWGYAGGTRTHPNPGNAYIRIFVPLQDPTLALTPAQIDTLAYADCAPDGMMGDDCMTGTTEAGYGTIGSMRGYPLSQTVTRR